ncbi:hypothetical protein DEO72_LG10g18 [Vigna unguiculata]|uniref:Uncharacterized protein n=1 Tax=Vigna unguiculata TaxID=3917 RepID=A0A4D6N7G1_VIGUN|nr:hypothetical protein DEO72_LG10g18 [Vigna unguiculata]
MPDVTMSDSNTHDQGEDPYKFIFDHSRISASQEEYLRDLCVRARGHHSPSTSVDSPVVPLDVFHTPPENTSPPSFCDQPTAATECDHPCTVNHAVDVDAATQGFIYLSEGLNLGFSGVQPSQGTNVVGESSVKTSKFSEGDMGSEKEPCTPEVVDSFRGLLEFTQEEEKDLEDFTLLEVTQASEMVFPRPNWWPEGFDGLEKPPCSDDVYTALLKIKTEKEKNFEDLNLLEVLEVAKACGMVFTPPRWWPGRL